MSLRRSAVAVVMLSTVGVLVGAFSGHAQVVQAQPLAGVWELVSIEDHWPDGKVTNWLGRQPKGIITYTRAGRMSVQFMGDPRPLFEKGNVFKQGAREILPSARPDEIREALVGYYAYYGTYDVDTRSHVITHHVTASLRPNEVGIDYVRPYELTDNVITLTYPATGEDGVNRVRMIVFRNVERF